MSFQLSIITPLVINQWIKITYHPSNPFQIDFYHFSHHNLNLQKPSDCYRDSHHTFYFQNVFDHTNFIKTFLNFTNRIRHLSAALESMGVNVDEEEMEMAALNGLPDRLDNLISAMDALGNEERTFSLEFVKFILLQEEQRMTLLFETQLVKLEASVFVSERKFSQTRQKCTFCNKLGHPHDRCFQKYPEIAPLGCSLLTKSRPHRADHLTNEVSGRTTNQIFLVTKRKNPNLNWNKNKWIIDSGCT